jgi:hypothetical protein
MATHRNNISHTNSRETMSLSHGTTEDGEKQGKIRQSDQQRVTSVLLFLGFLCLIFLASVVKLKHSPMGGTNALRRYKMGSEVIPQTVDLPPNSIYRLVARDAQGLPHKMSKYAGMVTLIVNVASK